MGTTTSTALISVKDFLCVPEPKEGHYELHHGSVVLMPPSNIGHQRIQERLREIISQMIQHKNAIVRVEMAFQPAPDFEVWKADVGVVSAEREKLTPADAYLQGAPELVIEVLSPGNTVDEIEDKMHVCLNHGCQSFWVVDDKRKEVRATETDFVTRPYNSLERIPLTVIPGGISVQDIFVY